MKFCYFETNYEQWNGAEEFSPLYYTETFWNI